MSNYQNGMCWHGHPVVFKKTPRTTPTGTAPTDWTEEHRPVETCRPCAEAVEAGQPSLLVRYVEAKP